MGRPEEADEEITAMLQEVRTLSKEAFFGEDSVQKAADRGIRTSTLPALHVIVHNLQPSLAMNCHARLDSVPVGGRRV